VVVGQNSASNCQTFHIRDRWWQLKLTTYQILNHD